MLPVFGLLLACQLAGEVLVRAAGLPLPGPVLGLCLLAGLLFLGQAAGYVTREGIDAQPIGKVTAGLLGVLGLLFVPAGVGAIDQLPLLREYGLALAVALIGSTVLTLIVTVSVYLAVLRLLERRRG
jgi:holin-like protein